MVRGFAREGYFMKIVLNALNAKSGGGKSILINFLKLLNASNLVDCFFVMTPCASDYKQYESEHVKIMDTPAWYSKSLLSPFVYCYRLPKLIRQIRPDVIFNMGDLVIRTKMPQVYLYDWPYAAYPESQVWKRMSFSDKFQKRIKRFFFKRNIGFASCVAAQTADMKKRLEHLYGLKNVKVVPNAVSLDNLAPKHTLEMALPKGNRLLYLTYFYPHKNLEIFIPLAKLIQQQNLDFKLIVTLSPSQHSDAAAFLQTIEAEGLTNIIHNVGPVPMEQVPALYQACDGLLMPTLLESFSGTYVEAMFHEIPIFTSDLDFAHAVCAEAAFYFDPLNAKAILDTLKAAFDNAPLCSEKLQIGRDRLAQMPSWEAVFDQYLTILKGVAEKP